MSDIPADILFNAKCLVSEWELISRNVEHELVVSAIARALKAERERCAKIAEGCGDRAIVFMNEKLGGYSNDFQRYSDGCMSVANAIRGKIESGANAAADSSALAKSSHEEAANGGGND